MSEPVERSKGGLRKIADPFVVAPPAGVRTRTRLRPTPDEERALEHVGVFLGSLSRQALASRIRLGRASGKEQAQWRAGEKQQLTRLCSSRWAGAITRTAIDSYHLGMRGLAAEVASLRAATLAITTRMGVRAGERITDPQRPWVGPVKGYATTAERFEKSRRRVVLAHRLDEAIARLDAGSPRVVAGGGRLWRARANLAAAQLTRAEWSHRWADERMFLTADGETGKRHGNETIRVAPEGVVTVKVPTALVPELGRTRLTFTTAVSLATHRGHEWGERVAGNKAVRYDVHRDERGRWYVDASWGYGDVPVTPLEALQGRRTLGVDLNDGHLDVAVLDAHGNVIGTPARLDVDLAGRTTGARDAALRHAVTRLIHHAKAHGCASITIENLGFDDARSTGRETMGRGNRGKTLRRKVAGIPTGRFRDRLVGMTATAGLAVIAVDPAYTSRWASQHWKKPLQQTTDPAVDGHRAAAVVIGRRGLGHRARRKPVGPRTRQRTRAGQPTSQPPRPGRRLQGPTTRQPRAHDAAGTRDP